MAQMHPALFLMGGALLVCLLPGRWRAVGLVGGPLLALINVLRLGAGTEWLYQFLGYELVVLQVDTLSLVFGLIFAIISLLGAIYALHVENRGEHAAALLYAAGSLGVVFAGDWFTLFFFWELMAASSVFLIWYRRRPSSLAAGFRYLIFHLVGGNLLLFGILLLAGQGQFQVSGLTAESGLAFWLILLGVGINAAIPPLHPWLTDAYPEATVTGAVFMSAFTTKAAVYVLLRVFAGTEFLIWAGVAMALYGVVYAVLENDIRRLLAYHIVSQVGYMVAGAGIGTPLAIAGATAHAFSHILYKSLLFMGAGAVIQTTGREKLTELGGIAKTMPLTVVLYTVGAFSISGVPLFNGFISKSLIVTAAGASGLGAAELLLTLASVGTFLHTGLKLPYFTFFGKDRGLKPAKVPVNMHMAMGGGAFLCILFGVYPLLLYSRLPYTVFYEPYTADHVISTLQLLLATAVGFWLYLARLGGQPTVSLDTDWFYRRPLAWLLSGIVSGLKKLRDAGEEGVAGLFRVAAPYFANPFLGPVRLAQAISGKAGQFGESGPYDAARYRPPLGLGVLVGMVILVIYFVILFVG